MAQQGPWYQAGAALRKLLLGVLGQGRGTGTPSKQGADRGSKPASRSSQAQQGTAASRAAQTSHGEEASPGQCGTGATRDLSAAEAARVRFEYAPNPDGDPDPGEVIWTWVPYVENDGRGKDRPVLIVGRLDETAVVGCYLSTKYHRDFVSVGSGAWDSQGRESFLSPERLLRITEEGMRRESVQIDRGHFVEAAAAVAAWHGLRG